jgi:hypothetical protein
MHVAFSVFTSTPISLHKGHTKGINYEDYTDLQRIHEESKDGEEIIRNFLEFMVNNCNF